MGAVIMGDGEVLELSPCEIFYAWRMISGRSRYCVEKEHTPSLIIRFNPFSKVFSSVFLFFLKVIEERTLDSLRRSELVVGVGVHGEAASEVV